SASNVCVHRDYGKGGTVCVCNTTHCDTFDDIIKTSVGIITRYESSKSGKRFEKQTFKFSNESFYELQSGGKTVTINRNKKYQQIIGFGGAFTDAATINILSLKPELSQQIISDYYSQNGLNYSIGRIPIAGSDFSTRLYTYDDINEDLELKNFSLADEDLKYKIPLIKRALSLKPHLKLFGSPWSAPAWMKDNHNLTGKGTLKGIPGGPYYKAWAQYFINSSAKYVSGIAFHWYLNSLSPLMDLDKTHQQFPNVFLLSTEACEGSNPFVTDKVSLGNWDRAQAYAYDIITDLQHFTAGWVDWNLALDETGGPNWVKNFVDAPIIVNSSAQEYYKQPMYYSLAHFTKFLPSHSLRVHSDDTGAHILETVVFETPDK
ncbi:unnamed protein product, partial [Oppiella nova]